MRTSATPARERRQRLPAGAARGLRNMEQNDLWTAACAIAAGATLLTADMDFLHLHPTPLLVEYVDPR